MHTSLLLDEKPSPDFNMSLTSQPQAQIQQTQAQAQAQAQAQTRTQAQMQMLLPQGARSGELSREPAGDLATPSDWDKRVSANTSLAPQPGSSSYQDQRKGSSGFSGVVEDPPPTYPQSVYRPRTRNDQSERGPLNGSHSQPRSQTQAPIPQPSHPNESIQQTLSQNSGHHSSLYSTLYARQFPHGQPLSQNALVTQSPNRSQSQHQSQSLGQSPSQNQSPTYPSSLSTSYYHPGLSAQPGTTSFLSPAITPTTTGIPSTSTLSSTTNIDSLLTSLPSDQVLDSMMYSLFPSLATNSSNMDFANPPTQPNQQLQSQSRSQPRYQSQTQNLQTYQSQSQPNQQSQSTQQNKPTLKKPQEQQQQQQQQAMQLFFPSDQSSLDSRFLDLRSQNFDSSQNFETAYQLGSMDPPSQLPMAFYTNMQDFVTEDTTSSTACGSSHCQDACHGACDDEDICQDPDCEGVSDICCEDDTCSVPCVDKECQPSDVKDAAAALTSFGFSTSDGSSPTSHAQPQNVDGTKTNQTHPTEKPNTKPYGSSKPMAEQLDTCPSIQPLESLFSHTLNTDAPINWNAIATDEINHTNLHQMAQELYSHLMLYHGATQPPQDHVRPCIADNALNWPHTCHLPSLHAGADLSVSENVEGGHPGSECGILLSDPSHAFHHFENSHNLSMDEILQLPLADLDCSMPGDRLTPTPIFEPVASSHPSEGWDTFPANQSLLFPLNQQESNIRHFPASVSTTSTSTATATPSKDISAPVQVSNVFPKPTFANLASVHHHNLARSSSPGPAPSISSQAETTPNTSASVYSLDTDLHCRWLANDGNSPEHECGLVFSSAEALHQHLLKDHAKLSQRPSPGADFQCGWASCPRRHDQKGFGQRSKLERHVQTHSGYKPFVCPMCHELFSAKQALDQHIRTHTNDRPYICTHPGCGKTFKQQSSLTMHERIHSGKKPLACPFPGCTMRFSESSNLAKHRRTHNVSGAHVCVECGRDFHRLDQLRRHMARVHGPKTCGTGKDHMGDLANTKKTDTDGLSLASLPLVHSLSSEASVMSAPSTVSVDESISNASVRSTTSVTKPVSGSGLSNRSSGASQPTTASTTLASAVTGLVAHAGVRKLPKTGRSGSLTSMHVSTAAL